MFICTTLPETTSSRLKIHWKKSFAFGFGLSGANCQFQVYGIAKSNGFSGGDVGISWDELPKPGMKETQWLVFVIDIKKTVYDHIREAVCTIQVGFQVF